MVGGDDFDALGGLELAISDNLVRVDYGAVNELGVAGFQRVVEFAVD